MSVEAKVAEVLPPHELVFNCGSSSGVQTGDIAHLIREREIKDPETNEILGTVRRSMARFRIGEVQEKLSVGRSLDTVGDAFENLLRPGVQSLRAVTGNPTNANERTLHVRVGAPAFIVKPEKPSESDQQTEK